MTLTKTRMPVTLQGEANECGLACLQMILGHYGVHLPLSALRQDENANQAITLLQLKQMATRHHLNARALRCELEDLSELTLPAILHVDFDHFVVITHVARGSATIIDPAHGKRQVSRDELNRRFTGIVLELEPGVGFKKTGSDITYSPIRFLRQLPVTNLINPLTLLLLLSICVQAFALITPFYFQIIIDEALLVDSSDLIVVVTFGFAMVYLVSAITQWFRGLVVIHVGNRLSYLLSAWLFGHLMTLPIRFFERRTIGDIISRFGSLKPMQDFITGSAVGILIDSLMVLTTFAMLMVYSGKVALAILVILVIYVVFQYALYFPMRARTHEALIADARLQSHFIESTRIVGSLKRFDAEDKRLEDWLGKLVVGINAEVRVDRTQLVFELSRYLLSAMTLLTVVYLASTEVASLSLTIGMLYTMVAYTNHLTSAVLSLTSEWQRFLMLSLHVQRVSDILDAPADGRTVTLPIKTVNRIDFRATSFAYAGQSTNLVERLDLAVDENQSVAVTGPSGSGKSTLLQLLMGFETPQAGEILINGQPVPAAARISPLFSSVLQTDQLVAGTLLENITFFSPNPDPEKAIRCAQLASIHEDIGRLPLGYRQKVSEMGCELSAGQQQRVLIARALYRKAPVLLLDEGTCHLDLATEMHVISNVITRPGICLFVTHRPEVAVLADIIVTLPGTVDKNTSPAFAAS